MRKSSLGLCTVTGESATAKARKVENNIRHLYYIGNRHTPVTYA